MAYQREYDHARSPHATERPRSTWDTIQRPHYPSMPSPSHHMMASPSILDPESETSDVSDNPGEDYHTRIHSTYPISIPPPPSKHILESLDAIEARLRDLQRIEDLNIKRQDQLRAKRARKDDRIRRKREAQDIRIKAIMDTRARRDERIGRRRKLEDDAFERFDQDLEEEETNLRKRQKRLKRGLPVEDVAMGSRISSASMSPPGPMYSNAPPPPKRHQTGPPGQNNSPVVSTPRPVQHNTPSAPNSAGPNPPPYAFLQSSHPPPTSIPYGRSPTISHSPASTSGTFQPMPRSEPSPYTVNGHPPSPHTSRPPPAPPGSVLNTAPPPKPAASYDTRPPPPPPPPPATSGFASINTPPTSGFAAINPRTTGTPPAPQAPPTLPGPPSYHMPKANDNDRMNGHARTYVSEGTPTGTSALASSKRTPSTTHPYQMSEAFANRHHHCERVDHLNRGIWTSYGPGGTKEMPTGPAQEMYLRCNHDGCRRIDWRTVHGLQCHIVKNHEQPKGTIGSLEKALDRYGVPVAEVEAYEKEHGDGSGGTMADPKNLKIKAKSRESTERADGQRKPYIVHPAAYSTNIARSFSNSTQPYQGSPASMRSLPHEDTEDSENDVRSVPANLAAKPSKPASGFASVNGGWSTIPDPKPTEPKDIVMKDVPASPHGSGIGSVPKRDTAFWKTWPGDPTATKPQPTGNISTPAPLSVSQQGPPASLSSSSTQDNVPSHTRTGSTPLASVLPAQPPSIPSTPAASTNKVEHITPKDLGKVDHVSMPAINETTQTSVLEQSLVKPTETVQDTAMAGMSEAEPVSAPQVTTKTEKEPAEVQQLSKETEKPKIETIEPARVEPKSPQSVNRREPGIRGRRGSSRRHSVAASTAEKEREREREEAAAAAAAKAEADAKLEREKERERQEKEEGRNKTEPELEKDQEKDEDGEGGEDSDDPDTITAAVPSSVSDEKDKDKNKEGRDNKTRTPTRLANGRFVRKR